MALQIGDCAAHITLVRPGGDAFTLAEYSGQPLFLIFLRHLT
jgi:hypothetical protein